MTEVIQATSGPYLNDTPHKMKDLQIHFHKNGQRNILNFSISHGPVGPKALTTPDAPLIMGEANAQAIKSYFDASHFACINNSHTDAHTRR